MTEVTVEGVTYRRGERINALPLQGVFLSSNPGYEPDDLMRLKPNNWTKVQLYTKGIWKDYNPYLELASLYEAIVVEKQPEWVEVKNGYYAALENGETYHEAAEALSKDIAETLKAQRIRIHNVDGSVTEYGLSHKGCVRPWTVFYSVPQGGNSFIAMEEVQIAVQLAFMRGSKVEVLANA